jgi:sugar phosphate isomerase/epimerase
MLLTLATRSLAPLLDPSSKDEESLSLLELPDYAIRHLQLRGLNVPASTLAGWSLSDLDALRDHADKAGCPCLVLFEDAPLPFGDPDVNQREAAKERVRRLAAAAHRLGCNSLAVACEGPDTDETFEIAADEIKAAIQSVERLELNLLLEPAEGLTASPDRLTELIKRIGGFRIGSLPSFGHAASTGDLVGTLRKLAPYAGAVHATVESFTRTGNHRGYDLAEAVEAIRSVGFLNTLAIDYTGTDDPVGNVEKARAILQEAIEADS